MSPDKLGFSLLPFLPDAQFAPFNLIQKDWIFLRQCSPFFSVFFVIPQLKGVHLQPINHIFFSFLCSAAMLYLALSLHWGPFVFNEGKTRSRSTFFSYTSFDGACGDNLGDGDVFCVCAASTMDGEGYQDVSKMSLKTSLDSTYLLRCNELHQTFIFFSFRRTWIIIFMLRRHP